MLPCQDDAVSGSDSSGECGGPAKAAGANLDSLMAWINEESAAGGAAQKKRKKKAEKQNLKANNPSQEQLSSLLKHYQNGRLNDAEKLATTISKDFPNHHFAWKVLGAVFKQTG